MANLARIEAVPGSYVGAQNVAEHVSCAALANWREDQVLADLADADHREARALTMLRDLILRAARDRCFSVREERQALRIVDFLRACDEQENAATSLPEAAPDWAAPDDVLTEGRRPDTPEGTCASGYRRVR